MYCDMLSGWECCDVCGVMYRVVLCGGVLRCGVMCCGGDDDVVCVVVCWW